jgi:hypothetical protein
LEKITVVYQQACIIIFGSLRAGLSDQIGNACQPMVCCPGVIDVIVTQKRMCKSVVANTRKVSVLWPWVWGFCRAVLFLDEGSKIG